LRVGLVDLPSSRRTRARAVPTTGGIVIFLTTAASLLFALKFYSHVAPNVAFKLSALLAGGTVIVVLGMIDDRINLRPGVKLAVQVAVAVAMVASGVALERICFFLGPAIELGWLRYPITVFWLVGFMNAFNLIDGLDGLAGGIAVIAASGLFVVGLTNDNALLYMMIAGIFGSSIGFLLHNFREGNVYLGDAGSMGLGFFLAGGAVIGGWSDLASNAVLVVGACMVVPAFDVLTTIVRRGRARTGVMTPDQSHTHHRLIRFGLNPKAAVIVLWGVTVFFGWQMLGFVAPFGLVYLLGSYVVALGVANVLMEQRRKNLKTLQSDLKEEMSYLVGLRGADETESPSSLREIIVAQIRREALYRRMVRDEAAGRTPEATPPVEKEKNTDELPV
ncbi:MAG: undecaprenyl/decaprenyl-phosphate alpha-N-acetylglucosaminyl 1-phosphate transferase, partial [Candidatus Eisenbacteria sp.]|nr:undecaprenyl/decaprenyl-phosphate alpha-N-acetylglucosaminyl 1-phosphate transferase [Candidatus Eisenbacteria bacterium]